MNPILKFILAVWIWIFLFCIIAYVILWIKEVKMDNPKKKKADSKRIALTQVHERSYMKRICKEQLDRLQQQDGKYIYGESITPKCSKAKLIRITKCCMKLMKKYEEELK